MSDDTSTFEAHRPALVALAYRMLGDLGRAEDVVQDSWLRWQGRDVAVDAPKAFLLKIVTRLCLNELGSARARREEARGDRLPEPVALDDAGLGNVEMLDQISMAFLVVLQRLTPAERAVLLLHDVFDLSHSEIASLLKKTDPACRQLLSRARENVAAERRVLQTSREEHRRLLAAFVRASASGEVEAMMSLLAEDAVLVVDTGPEGRRVGRIRNVRRPIVGSKHVAAFLGAVSRQGRAQSPLVERELNGQPAMVYLKDGRPDSALLISVADGRIRHIFVQADPERLTHIGPLTSWHELQ
jgi:RNA polymerase sigma-70 factor (ECF subfamily)